MKLFGKKEQKQVTDFEKYFKSEIGTTSSQFNPPKFNRLVAVNAYEGYWSSAIDYNVNAAASGMIRLHAKVSNNGQKCIFDTTRHKDMHQRDFLDCKLEDKPSQNAQYKIMDSRENFEIVQGHPINDLFLRANPFQSTYEFFTSIYLNLEITGDAFIHVVSFPDGKPASLLTLQSQYMNVIPAEKGTGKLIDRYEYRKDSEIIRYEVDEIIHIKYENPKSVWYGMGKIEKGWNTYLLNKFSHEYQIGLYANHAVPTHLIINKSGNSISKKRFFNKMSNLFRGAQNAGGSMVVDGDIEIKSVAFAPKDLSDVQLNVQEIASISGCPINKLIGNDAIKANSEEQNTSWLRNTVSKMMKIVASALSEGLLPRYGIEDGTAFLEYDTPVPADKEELRKQHDSYLQNGTLTNNEVRIEIGREALSEELDKTYFKGKDFGSPEVQPFVEEVVEEEDDLKSMLVDIVKDMDMIKNQKAQVPVVPVAPNINITVNEVPEEIVQEEE